MTAVYTLRIDGRDVAATEGQTIMDVAEESGIDIPGLCHLPGIHDRGACRLCMVEVPMGMTLREIIYDIGGGIIDGRPFKAVQTGGPSGGCIPAEHIDMPVSYESLIELGSFMGSGGMIIMDDTSCMVDVAKYFQDFCRDESCGKCVPCRVGTTQLWMLLDAITRGKADMDDLAQLERLAHIVQRMSLCGLGQGAPNPIFSTLRYFRDEYMAHIVDKVCPAGVCEIEQPVEVMA